MAWTIPRSRAVGFAATGRTVAAVLILVACGGGSGTTDSPSAPADAGPHPDARATHDAADEGDAGGADGAGTDTGPVTLPESAHGLVFWRGFDHRWLRSVVGFLVPHRISKLETRIASEAHSGTGAGWSASAVAEVGQDTGVDGNFMKPVVHVGGFSSPHVFVERGSVRFQFTDDGNGSAFPQARSDLHDAIAVDLRRGSLGGGRADEVALVMTGIDLKSVCDDRLQPANQPCNSNGMWPFDIGFSLGACEGTGQARTCPVDARIHRAWTPNRGGISALAEKPFDDRLTFDLVVHYAVVAGPRAALHVVRDRVVQAGEGHDAARGPTTVRTAGQAGATHPRATVAITGIGFRIERLPTQTEAKFGHLGRYIGALQFGVEDQGYDPATGLLSWSHFAQVSLPDTVENAAIHHTVEVAVLQLGADAVVARPRAGTGAICQNSDGAPFFSTWTECGRTDTGPERDEDNIRLIVAP